MDSVAIAFSGGVDSTFLTKVAYDVLGEKAIAVTASSPTFPQIELDAAKQLAEKIGIGHIVIDSEETKNINFVKNPINRCYYCKKELFSKIKQVAAEKKLNFVIDGSNADDASDYRPGTRALKKLNVISPLQDVGLTKKEIKELSKDMNLDTWDKPSFACLASRFPYGIEITISRLKQVEDAEAYLNSLGIKQFRVRYHNEVARIEVSKNDFDKIIKHSDNIVQQFKKLGFKYIALDMDGYRTGSLNEVLEK